VIAQVTDAQAEILPAKKRLNPIATKVAPLQKLQPLQPKLAPVAQSVVPKATAVTTARSGTTAAQPGSTAAQPGSTAALPTSSVAQTVHAPMPITLAPQRVTRYTVGQIGHMVFRNAVADLGGTAIAIKTYPDFRGGQTVLTGAVLKCESDDNTNPNSVTGLVIFTAGDSIAEFAPDDQDDLVFTPAGAVEGKITLAANNSLSVASRTGTQTNVHVDSILYVRSPRCFTFQTVTASGAGVKPAMTFKATSQSRSFSMSSVVPHDDAADEEFEVRPEGPAQPVLMNTSDSLNDHPMLRFMDKLTR
jgi:hypothetical protein